MSDICVFTTYYSENIMIIVRNMSSIHDDLKRNLDYFSLISMCNILIKLLRLNTF